MEPQKTRRIRLNEREIHLIARALDAYAKKNPAWEYVVLRNRFWKIKQGVFLRARGRLED